MAIDCKNKDYSLQSYNTIVTNLTSIFNLLGVEISEYCNVNLTIAINGGNISDRIDITVHHIQKIKRKRANNG